MIVHHAGETPLLLDGDDHDMQDAAHAKHQAATDPIHRPNAIG